MLDIFKHRTVKTAYANTYVEVDSAETDFLLWEHELDSLIEKEIQAMPAKMREIYVMKRQQYMTTKEIAEALNISEHTVNTQMKRTLQHTGYFNLPALYSPLGNFVTLVKPKFILSCSLHLTFYNLFLFGSYSFPLFLSV